MKQLKYFALLALFLLVEAVLIFGMFAFVTSSRLVYIIISLVLMIGGIAYLIVSRYREKVKVKPKVEVWNGYIKVIFTTFVVLFTVLAGLIFIRALVFVIRGS